HNVTFPMASVAAQLANRSSYNVDTDFAGVSIAVYVPLVITAHPSVPANDLKQLVELLQKDKSLKYTYGSTGPGSFMHVMGEAHLRPARGTDHPRARLRFPRGRRLERALRTREDAARRDRATAEGDRRGGEAPRHGEPPARDRRRAGGLERRRAGRDPQAPSG